MKLNPMDLPEKVLYIINELRSAGYRADVVGGAVRDHLLGRSAPDYDITTSATPGEVKAVFFDKRIVDTGIKHGTVTLVLDHEPYEITTWRLDGDYLDHRHPDGVRFTASLEEDLARRDFTVNAICYNPYDGFTDLFGGMDDLDNKVIRAIGDPTRRFTEDALRIMRAIRFSATLGFTLEKATLDAAISQRHTLDNVSRERIFTELNKLFSGSYSYDVVAGCPEIIKTAVPELLHIDLPERRLYDAATPELRILSLFALSTTAPAEAFDAAYLSLKSDKASRERGRAILDALSEPRPSDEYSALRLLSSFGVDVAQASVELGMILGRREEGDLLRIKEAVYSGKPYKISMLSVGGIDLIKKGIKGKAIGETLSHLLDLVMQGRLSNDAASLLSYLDA
ncbi:MAG: polynucleotide adenylyltransferase [Clostridia bacterium]|nr:polynucleotide adenylyltransferase [Clostridia bacterium]